MKAACEETLKQALASIFKGEDTLTLNLVTDILLRLAPGDPIGTREITSREAGIDTLLLMDEWRLIRPIGGSSTKAWEDVSQLIGTGRDLPLDLLPWIRPLIHIACKTGKLSVRKAIHTFLSEEDHPARDTLPGFLLEMARNASAGVIDAAQINRLLRKIPLQLSADTLIAQAKSYGFISPHLRADFFRMRTPHYEVHPLLIHAATRGENCMEPSP